MLWCGVVIETFGVVWCGVMRCGVVGCGVLCCGVVVLWCAVVVWCVQHSAA